MTLAQGLSNPARRSSDLSKHSAAVFAEAEQQPVTVTRRDGESLVLMSQREAQSRSQLLTLAGQLITVALDEHGTLIDRMTRSFPWMLSLSTADQETCTRDLLDAARASFATDQSHLALTELTAWKETATAIAAGMSKVDLVWLDDDTTVDRP